MSQKTVTLGEQENSSKVKPSLESYKLADVAVSEEISSEESNPSLKEAWIHLGNQLEIDGIPKDQVCLVAKKLLIEKKSEKTELPIDEIKLSSLTKCFDGVSLHHP